MNELCDLAPAEIVRTLEYQADDVFREYDLIRGRLSLDNTHEILAEVYKEYQTTMDQFRQCGALNHGRWRSLRIQIGELNSLVSRCVQNAKSQINEAIEFPARIRYAIRDAIARL